jgi:uncharacterized protein (TIGR02996 family)
MDQEKAIKAAIIDNPNDRHPRLVLADYYDDNGMPEHAAVHRTLATNPQSLHTAEGADQFINTPGLDHFKIGHAVSDAARLMSTAAHKAATASEVLAYPNRAQWDVEPSSGRALESAQAGHSYITQRHELNGAAQAQHESSAYSHDRVVRGLTNRLNDEVWPEGSPAREKHRSPLYAHTEARDYNRAAATVHDAILVKKTGYDHRNDPVEE